MAGVLAQMELHQSTGSQEITHAHPRGIAMGLDYVARCQKCNRFVCWTSQTLEEHDKAELSRNLAQWVRWGLSIERMETEKARTSDEFWHSAECPDHPDNRKKRRDKRRDSRQKEFI